MPERVFPADKSALDDVLAFTGEQLEAAECPVKSIVPLTVAIEEMFVNVADHAYPGEGGIVKYSIVSDGNTVTFRLADSGIPFDPLSIPDPDTTLSAEEREIGGLGIFMMKKTMDEVHYERRNGENILTMKKYLI